MRGVPRLFPNPVSSRCDGQWRLQAEVQFGFRAESDLLAASNGLCAGTGRSARTRTNGRAFPAAGDTTDDRAQRRATAYFFSRVLAAGGSLLRPLVGLDVVGLAVHHQTCQLNGERGRSAEVRCVL